MPEKSKKDYEQLGRRVENIFLTGYISRAEMLKISFLRGVATGFGGIIGATIVVALLAWLLSFFHTVPFVGPLVDSFRNTVDVRSE